MAIDNYNSKEKVYEFLRKHAVAVLSTVSSDGTPGASPIYFIPDEALNFYFITKSDTLKSKNIQGRHNHVAMTVIDPEIPMTVQAKGSVSEIQDPNVFTKIATENAKQKAGFHWPPPLYKLKSEGFIFMYKFEPSWLRVGDFSESSENNKEIFYQII